MHVLSRLVSSQWNEDRVETARNAEGELPAKGSAYCSFPNLRMSEMPSVTEHVESGDDPWTAIRHNYVYLWRKLRCTDSFLRCLFERTLITEDDFQKLKSDSVDQSVKNKKDFLLLDVLPKNQPKMFGLFCEVLCNVGQRHVAETLTKNFLEVRLLPPGPGNENLSKVTHPIQCEKQIVRNI